MEKDKKRVKLHVGRKREKENGYQIVKREREARERRENETVVGKAKEGMI